MDLEEARKKTKVADWMTRDPVTIDVSASLIEAINLLKEKNIRRLPVLRKGQLAGIVTERMLREYTPSKATALDAWELHYLLSKSPVTQVMNSSPVTVQPDDDIVDAAKVVYQQRLYGLCVVDRPGHLVGLLTFGNFIQVFLAWGEALRKV